MKKIFIVSLLCMFCVQFSVVHTEASTEFSSTGSIVITSDPQYPWTDKTDRNEPESDSEKNARSEQLIRDQYSSINAYMQSVSTPGPVLINGDITAFGHGWQWNKMKELLGTLQAPYYYGLGNHDIENNMNDCFDNSCIHNSLTSYIQHVKNIPTTRFDLKTSEPFASTHSFGSFAYSTEIGPIHSVQLNNYPTMEFPKASSSLGTATFTMESSLDWLEQDLKEASQYGQAIIINLHEPGGWKTGPSQRFINLLKQYNVKAVFAGHYHTENGLSQKYKEYFGDVPVFVSGSAAQKTYLISEYTPTNIKIYAVKNNDWRSKSLLQTIDISNRPAPVFNTDFELYEHSNGLGKQLKGLPHAEWNDKISSVRLPPHTAIELYENSKFDGRKKVLENPSNLPRLYNLYDFNDVTSSYIPKLL